MAGIIVAGDSGTGDAYTDGGLDVVGGPGATRISDDDEERFEAEAGRGVRLLPALAPFRARTEPLPGDSSDGSRDLLMLAIAAGACGLVVAPLVV